uniref:Variant surface glycoprotein 1703 n=1 Tax=Trypanosoma brucei TaxID=5691 RepID=M4SZ34_9TRYP|nr:variant surface glycoprotein 1703 [Trypanosoma brucei]
MALRAQGTVLAILIASAVVIDFPLKAKASAKAFSETKIKQLCSTATALSKAANVALKKEEKLTSQITAAQQAAMQALVAATTAATPQQDEMYSAAAVAAMQCAATALNNLQNFQAKALKAAANGGKIAGHISELVNLLAVMSKGGTTGTCIDGSGGNAPDGVNSAKQLGCPAAVLNPTADLDKLDDNEVKATGFAKYDGTSAAGSTATQKCHLLLTSGNSAGHLWQDNTPGPQELLLGLLSVTPHNSHASTAINLGTANTIAAGFKAISAATELEKMYDALVAAQKEDDGGCGVTPEHVLKTVISSGKAKELINLYGKILN